MIGNRNACRGLAEQFDVPFYNIADEAGEPDYDEMARLIDEYDVDYVVLARYMRVLPARICWELRRGGSSTCTTDCCRRSRDSSRTTMPSSAHADLRGDDPLHRPRPRCRESDHQPKHIQRATRTPPSEIIRIGKATTNRRVLSEGLKRVVDREVELHFHRVVRTKP